MENKHPDVDDNLVVSLSDSFNSNEAFRVSIETAKDDNTAELPSNVSSQKDLASVPAVFLGEDFKRPLLSYDSKKNTYKHSLKPMFYSAIFILLMEGLERFSYYGIFNTLTAYLSGKYEANLDVKTNQVWAPNFSDPQVLSYVNLVASICYSTPFIGAIMADVFVGDFLTIAIATSLTYIPGLLLIALTTYPRLLGDTFNDSALFGAILGLYPLGSGSIKSVVNVFGAKQFHPLLQSDLIAKYYIHFYMFINAGGLVGGIAVPILAQSHLFAAYMIPVAALTLGLIIFLSVSNRYVKMKTQPVVYLRTLKALWTLIFSFFEWIASKTCNNSCCGNNKVEKPKEKDPYISDVKKLFSVLSVSCLTIPFNVAYGQMSSSFVSQGSVMTPLSFIDASMMTNFDAIGVIIVGFLVSTVLYPYMARNNISIKTSHFFAFGSGLSAMSIVCAIIVETQIHSYYNGRKEKISVMWQIFQFIFIAAGEIFTVSIAYAAAFLISPKRQKGLSSACNLFVIGAIPNFISAALAQACSSWLLSSSGGKISHIDEYATAKVINFFYVLLGINLFGIFVNLLPFVSRYVESVIEIGRAQEMAGSEEAKILRKVCSSATIGSRTFGMNRHGA